MESAPFFSNIWSSYFQVPSQPSSPGRFSLALKAMEKGPGDEVGSLELRHLPYVRYTYANVIFWLFRNNWNAGWEHSFYTLSTLFQRLT